jgi:hypothetical protein
VHVAAPVVNVTPPEVRVDVAAPVVNVAAQPRTNKRIEHDAEGRIVGVTEVPAEESA